MILECDDIEWRPSASQAMMVERAKLLRKIRRYFDEQAVLEVDTPVLCRHTVSDPHLTSMAACYTGAGAPQGQMYYLQTSPEFAMKRLLAAGSGPIYQICKAFRDGESGRWHNPEFTMLEWYRPAMDYHRLMDDVESLLGCLMVERLMEPTGAFDRFTYDHVFERFVGLNPNTALMDELNHQAAQCGYKTSSMCEDERDTLLDFLMSSLVEPKLGVERPVFVYDYPESQAALARVRDEPQPVAERFELYVKGVEIANGYHELTDASVLGQRFEENQLRRQGLGLPAIKPDQRLLGALKHGLPASSGVALGVDRLLCVLTGCDRLDQVLAFPIARA